MAISGFVICDKITDPADMVQGCPYAIEPNATLLSGIHPAKAWAESILEDMFRYVRWVCVCVCACVHMCLWVCS